MAKVFMPSFECIHILKNHFVCNMWYGFDVCVYLIMGRVGLSGQKSWPVPDPSHVRVR
jgi:hypothetical protein